MRAVLSAHDPFEFKTHMINSNSFNILRFIDIGYLPMQYTD